MLWRTSSRRMTQTALQRRKIDLTKLSVIFFGSTKTGLYPRDRIPFEELAPGLVVDNKSAKLFRSNSRLNVDKETLNRIQNKKNVEKQIKTKEKELIKGKNDKKKIGYYR